MKTYKVEVNLKRNRWWNNGKYHFQDGPSLEYQWYNGKEKDSRIVMVDGKRYKLTEK